VDICAFVAEFARAAASVSIWFALESIRINFAIFSRNLGDQEELAIVLNAPCAYRGRRACAIALAGRRSQCCGDVPVNCTSAIEKIKLLPRGHCVGVPIFDPLAFWPETANLRNFSACFRSQDFA
jgi:hypothetical protein